MHDEIELKLSLTRAEAARLLQHPLLRALAVGRTRKRQLQTTYYDTRRETLRRKDMALRIRRDGKRLRQTLKLSVGVAGGARHFREFDSDLARARPDIGRLDGKLVESMFGAAKDRSLKPVFTTAFERRTVPVRLRDTEIEVAIDIGELRAGHRRLPICEAELELISGKPERLYELALALQESVPLRLEGRTKAARGYGLRNGRRLRPSKWTPVALRPGDTVGQALPVLVRSCIAHMLANVPVVLETREPGGVHQVRVALRRLRTLLRIARGDLAPQVFAHINAERRWLQRHLGPAREWDVFIADVAQPALADISDTPAARTALKAARAVRSEAYSDARATLRDARLTEFVLRVEGWFGSGQWSNGAPKDLARPVGQFAERALDRSYARCEALAERGDSLSDSEIHKLRIRIKTLRYTADFFASLYDRAATERFLNAARHIQDLLGDFNDAVVGQGLADMLETRLERPAASRAALSRIRARLAAFTECDRRELVGAWREFERADKFW